MIRRLIGQAAPYATAFYFVIWLAAQASAEFIHLRDLLLPLAIAFSVATVAHLGAWICTRSADKAALIAVVAVLLFSATGHILNALAEAEALDMPGGIWVPVGLLVVVGVAFVAAIARASRPVTGVLPVLTWAALGLSLFNVASTRLVPHRGTPEKLRPSEITAAPLPRGVRPPDVYLIILDKYTSSSVLADQYGFDNTPFTDFLRHRGFAVPRAGRANYVQTFLSLGSMLNLEYLDWLPDSLGIDNPRWADAYYLVENNRLASFFREHGYRFVFVPSAFGVTRENRYADVQIPKPEDIRPEFVTAWLATTPIPLARYVLCELLGCVTSGGGYIPETAALLDWKFEALGALAGSGRPLFVLAHLAVPHEPYIYGPDCAHRPPYWPLVDTGDEAPRIRAAYLDQIRCLNRKVAALVTRLQNRSPVPPVIVIQGDHGHGLLGRNLPGFSEVRPWQVADRSSAFAAYAVPGMPLSVVPDSITLLNGMRLVLRQAFGADLPPLEDATYWSSFDRPYRFTSVH